MIFFSWLISTDQLKNSNPIGFIELKANYTHLYAKNYDCISVRYTRARSLQLHTHDSVHTERDTNFDMPKSTFVRCGSHFKCVSHQIEAHHNFSFMQMKCCWLIFWSGCKSIQLNCITAIFFYVTEIKAFHREAGAFIDFVYV